VAITFEEPSSAAYRRRARFLRQPGTPPRRPSGSRDSGPRCRPVGERLPF
jgi:hypothetical protein